MRLVRFLARGRPARGVLRDDVIVESAETQSGPPARGIEHRAGDVRLLAPCVPTKIVAVGLNYRDHAKELGMPVPAEPILFLKPPSAMIGPEDLIVRPSMSGRVDFEGELGIIIRDRASRLDPALVRDHILGYTCVNDVTARDLQRKDGQWTRAKSFDTFCPTGPWIETELDPDDLLIETHLNGDRRQSSRTSQFIFGVDRLVSFISQVMTLEPGDLIITGTPAGIGPMQAGDLVEVRIEGIGSLRNRVQ